VVAGDSKTVGRQQHRRRLVGSYRRHHDDRCPRPRPGQGVADWVDHRGPVEPEPPARHRRKLRERGTRAACATTTRAPTAGATVA
jgi:hypothetical protein